MKIIYIDNEEYHRNTVNRSVTLLAQWVGEFEQIEFGFVSRPTEDNVDPLYLSEDGQKLLKPPPSHGQITSGKVLDHREIDPLLLSEEDCLFVLDVHYGDAEGLQRYGMWLARYLTSRGVLAQRIVLLTNYEEYVTQSQDNLPRPWGAILIKNVVFHGKEPEKRLLTWLQGLFGNARPDFTRFGDQQARSYTPRVDSSIVSKAASLTVDLLDRQGIVGSSQAIQEILQTIAKVAQARCSCLILGENGTGKELVAKAIHHNSPRVANPFVPINCGALTETLLESELFGHLKGSFVGAYHTTPGKFLAAHGGTIFFDEIDSASMAFQVKLLRVLQERQFEHVGDTKTQAVDVRIIAATNADLEKLVAAAKFRQDLYYRLAVVTILMPPLRNHPEDVPQLIEYFLEKYNKENCRTLHSISPSIMQILLGYPWPGNVRELENTIEQAVVKSCSKEFTWDLLPPAVQMFAKSDSVRVVAGPVTSTSQSGDGFAAKVCEAAAKYHGGQPYRQFREALAQLIQHASDEEARVVLQSLIREVVAKMKDDVGRVERSRPMTDVVELLGLSDSGSLPAWIKTAGIQENAWDKIVKSRCGKQGSIVPSFSKPPGLRRRVPGMAAAGQEAGPLPIVVFREVAALAGQIGAQA